MSNTSSPVFRKAMKGYNKEDVNAYIISLSRRLEEAESALASATAENTENSKRIAEMTEECNRIPDLLEKISVLENELSESRKELSDEKEFNKALHLRVDTAERIASDAKSEYEKLCSSTGQILALASSTADDILRKAGDEAKHIIEDANTAKATVFQSISETAEGFTSDLNDYIKNAIGSCINKINENINTISPKKDDASKVVFINGD